MIHRIAGSSSDYTAVNSHNQIALLYHISISFIETILLILQADLHHMVRIT